MVAIEISSKCCSRCGQLKSFDSFNKSKREKFGLRNECRECQKAYSALPHVKEARRVAMMNWRAKPENRERKNELERNRRKDPAVKIKISEYGKDYQSRTEVKKHRSEWAKNYNSNPYVKEKTNQNRKRRLADPVVRAEHNSKARIYRGSPKAKERIKEYNSRPEFKNAKKLSASKPNVREKRLGYLAEYRKRPEVQSRKKDWVDYKYETDANFKVSVLLRSRLNVALKRGYKSGSAVRDLGCSIADFREYIQKQFSDDMTWENQGDVWHLDHIVPLALADLGDRDQFLLVSHYENYQPLRAFENHAKHARAPQKGEQGWERYQKLLALQRRKKLGKLT